MTWSYSGNPKSSPLDAVRFLIQDTNVEDQLVQDEEIIFLIEEEGNVKLATARLADVLGSQFSKLSSVSIGDYSESMSDISRNFFDLAKRLRIEANRIVKPYAGGISKIDRETDLKDRDLIQPNFARGLMDNDKH